MGKITLFFCAGGIYSFSAVFMLSSLLSIAYLMPVVVRAFFYAPDECREDPGHSDEHGDGISEAPMLRVVPLCVTALGALVIFLYAQDLYELLLPITEAVCPGEHPRPKQQLRTSPRR